VPKQRRFLVGAVPANSGGNVGGSANPNDPASTDDGNDAMTDNVRVRR